MSRRHWLHLFRDLSKRLSLAMRYPTKFPPGPAAITQKAGKSDGVGTGNSTPTLFAFNLLLLRATGFWRYPSEAAGRRGGLCARAVALGQRAFFNVNVGCNVAFVATKLMQTAIDTGSIRSITENLSDVLCIAFSLLQLLVLLEVEDRLLRLLDRIDGEFVHVLGTVYPGRRLDEVARQQRVGKGVALRTFLGFLTTGLHFAVIVTTTGRKKNALPIPIWTPFSQEDPATLGVLLMVEGVGVVLTVAGSGALSALFLGIFLAVQTQFRAVHSHFKAEAERLEDGAWDAAARKRTEAKLVEGVRLHQAVHSLADEMCAVLAPFLTVQLGVIVFIICVALFQVSIDPNDPGNLRFVALAACVIVESFVLCLMGTRLGDEASDVQLGLEAGDWYLQGKSIGYIVHFVSMRSQKPPGIIVANNLPVGLPVFLEMIRSSYSLLAFLQKRARNEVT